MYNSNSKKVIDYISFKIGAVQNRLKKLVWSGVVYNYKTNIREEYLNTKFFKKKFYLFF